MGERADVENRLRWADPFGEASLLLATVDVQVVWEPAWTPDRLSESARAALSMPMEELLPYRRVA